MTGGTLLTRGRRLAGAAWLAALALTAGAQTTAQTTAPGGAPPAAPVTLQAVPVATAASGAASAGDAAASGAAGPAAAATAAMAPGTPAMRLFVFFNRVAAEGQPAAECDSVRAVARSLPRTPAVASAALRALFAGPSDAERAAGWRSPFSARTADLLHGVRLVQGTAYVDLALHPGLMAAASSSCGAAELLVAIERTLRQFPSVRRVIVAIDGEPRRFYDAIGLRCDASNDHCDPRPFQAPAVRR